MQYGNYDAEVNNSISRYDFAQVLACKRELALIRPVRLFYASTGGYIAGTVLGRRTSDGFFGAYNDGGAGGLETATCVLLVDAVPSSGDTVLAPALFKGIVFTSALTGLDAAGKTDLGGRTIIDARGVSLFSF